MQKIIFSTESFVNTMLHTYSQTEKQTENMKKWQANRQIDRKIEIHTNVQTYRQTDRQTYRVYRKIRLYTENFLLHRNFENIATCILKDIKQIAK